MAVPTKRATQRRRQPSSTQQTPRPSLAATHPANYTQATTQQMPPPPSPSEHSALHVGKTSTNFKKPQTPAPNSKYPTPSPSPPSSAQDLPAKQPCFTAKSQRVACLAPKVAKEVSAQAPMKRTAKAPWEEHTDPTLTASDAPPFWSRNNAVLKSDTRLEYGNVVSPTFTIGLPFGTMTEAAHHYPSEERLAYLN